MSEQTLKHLTNEDLLAYKQAAALALETYGVTGAFENGVDPTIDLVATPHLQLVREQAPAEQTTTTLRDAS